MPSKQMMRIGVVCPYSLSIPGGVQAQVMGLARAFRRQGHEARVLAPCDGPPPATFVTPVGDSIPTAANGSVAPIAPDPSAALRTMRALNDEGFDVVHVHEPLTPGPGLTAVLMHMSPVVGTFHAAGDSASYRYLNAPLNAIAERLDVRCSVSEDAEQLARGYLGGEYVRMFNGVDIDRYRLTEAHRANHPTIFFCGRHEPRKGLAELLAALQQLPADVRCWVGGEGPATNELKQRYLRDPRIEWLGRISDAEKIARMRGATVFCAPSLMGESFGVVLIEAMAAGTAIVATDLPGYLNVAHPGKHALVVPVGDVDALATTLARALIDPGLRTALITAGAERANDFSMETLANRYLDLFRGLIDQAPPAAPPLASGNGPDSWKRRVTSRLLGIASR